MEEQTIQLKHPQGKKAVRIRQETYALLKTGILEYLKQKGDGTFTEISGAIAQDFQDRKVSFDGSLNWYLEWVKLDLEARQIIARIPKTSPQKYRLTGHGAG